MYTGSPARLTNYQNGGFDPAKPDEDVQILTRYDGAGNVTWQRDALGRWTSMEYDALGATASRTVGGQTTSYGYTGDGVLAKATTPTTTTNYLQDFAAPLAQVLNDGTTTALYGHERLAAQTPSATTQWRRLGLQVSCRMGRGRCICGHDGLLLVVARLPRTEADVTRPGTRFLPATTLTPTRSATPCGILILLENTFRTARSARSVGHRRACRRRWHAAAVPRQGRGWPGSA